MSDEQIERIIIGEGKNAERQYDASELLLEAVAYLSRRHEQEKTVTHPSQPFLVRDIVINLGGGFVTLYLEPTPRIAGEPQ